MKEIVATVTRNGQVTIPVAVRKHIGISIPDKIAFVLENDGQVVIRPVAQSCDRSVGSCLRYEDGPRPISRISSRT